MMNSDGHCAFDEPLDVKSKIQILRKGEVDISGKSSVSLSQRETSIKQQQPLSIFGTSPKNDFGNNEDSENIPSQVRLYLISQPITYSGCAWTQDEKSYRSSNDQQRKFSRSYSMVFDNDGDKDFVTIDNVNSPLGSKPISISTRNHSGSFSSSVPNSLSGSSSLEESFISDHVEYSINEDETKLFIRTNGFEKTKSKAPTPKETESRINQIIDNHNTGNDNQLFEKKAEPKETTSAFNSEKKDYKFDFKSFLQKLKDKSVVQLTRDIKKFTFEISNTDYTPEHPHKVQSFLAHIMREISSHEQWKNATEQDLMNAREGIEKYVMTKIYSKVFSPTLEDIEIDNQIGSRIALFKRVVTPANLDVSARLVTDPLFQKAIEELKKMSFYKTPRDKLICVSNCCHLTMNLLKRSMHEQSGGSGGNAPSADDFLPLLIFIVLRSNVPHLHSNINEYRNPQSLEGHSGYFLTSLESAMAFWQGCDHTMLNMDETTFQQMINFEDVFGKESVQHATGESKQQSSNSHIAIIKEVPKEAMNEITEYVKKEEKSPEKLLLDTVDSVKTPDETIMSPIMECEIQSPPKQLEESDSLSKSSIEESVKNCNNKTTTDEARVDMVSSHVNHDKKWENLVSFVKNNETIFNEFKFENATAEDLRLKDVNSLLEDYKQMVSILKHIKNQTNEN
ncbi:predicted protein [Naegleria gruberi]|uniref:Predicted protein n=1 Tax=Naegleria gruberi TaxID=5762 RepID=D2VPB1_NAEGR|nr:uncharacterized protein NAEGRDRAFT_51184 [Naegleria gruberi]EFC41401.1 predicted protein [Naegleria gruberi]|eukprot:XP_002674145.1 predicted protein [Naegleria gruberi strain NEG-M]